MSDKLGKQEDMSIEVCAQATREAVGQRPDYDVCAICPGCKDYKRLKKALGLDGRTWLKVVP